MNDNAYSAGVKLKMEPFSVLMSIYKNENSKFLRESLDSILNNTAYPDEIVMVKDGPLTPELETVLQKYQERTGLFHFVIHQKNQGLGLALRHGLLECKNELVARMDTDDICYPNRFEKQLKYLQENPEIAVVGSYVEEFSISFEYPEQIVRFPLNNDEIIKFAKKRNPLRHPTVMFRKSVVLASGNYRHFLWFEDYDLCIRMLLAGYKMANIPEILVAFRADDHQFERRGGVAYLKQEVRFQRFMLHSNFINIRQFVFNCSARSVVRLMPNGLRKRFYKTFLRSKI